MWWVLYKNELPGICTAIAKSVLSINQYIQKACCWGNECLPLESYLMLLNLSTIFLSWASVKRLKTSIKTISNKNVCKKRNPHLSRPCSFVIIACQLSSWKKLPNKYLRNETGKTIGKPNTKGATNKKVIPRPTLTRDTVRLKWIWCSR